MGLWLGLNLGAQPGSLSIPGRLAVEAVAETTRIEVDWEGGAKTEDVTALSGGPAVNSVSLPCRFPLRRP